MTDLFMRGLWSQVPSGPTSADPSEQPDWRQARFGDKAFLEQGKEEKQWFKVSAEARRVAGEEGPGAVTQLEQIEAIMDEVNEFLARSDVADAEKLEFLRRFLGKSDVDWEDGDEDKEEVASHFGPIFARLMGSDGEDIQEVLGTDTIDICEHFDQGALTATIASFESEFSKWKKDNDVKQQPDQALARFAKLNEEAEERRIRRKGMSRSEYLEDIERAKAELLEDVHQRRAGYAERA